MAELDAWDAAIAVVAVAASDLDQLADRFTAAPTFAALGDLGTSGTGGGGYAPSLNCRSLLSREDRRKLTLLANAYDAGRAARGVDRR